MKFLHSAAIWMAVALMVLPPLTCAEDDLEPTVSPVKNVEKEER